MSNFIKSQYIQAHHLKALAKAVNSAQEFRLDGRNEFEEALNEALASALSGSNWASISFSNMDGELASPGPLGNPGIRLTPEGRKIIDQFQALGFRISYKLEPDCDPRNGDSKWSLVVMLTW